MKITRRQLKKVISEELEKLNETRDHVQKQGATKALKFSILKHMASEDSLDQVRSTDGFNGPAYEILLDLLESGFVTMTPYEDK